MLSIYHVSWAQDGCMGLNAVVVAKDEKDAIAELQLDKTDKCQKASFVGIAALAIKSPKVLARESV